MSISVWLVFRVNLTNLSENHGAEVQVVEEATCHWRTLPISTHIHRFSSQEGIGSAAFAVLREAIGAW